MSCDKARERHLRITYGITCEQYEDILEAQDGRCAICRAKPRKIRLAVDHDHKTGTIWGLLCSKCNHRLLGQHGRDPDKYQRAMLYLDGSRSHVRTVLGDAHRVPEIVKRRAA